jgi:hypothetical protein
MPRDYKKEYANYQGRPEQKKNRALRNAARREAMKNGRASKGDGKDVHHIVPLAKGGGNGASNTMVTSRSQNRSFARTKNARMK